jgi:ABC-type sugar transport system permease subunit
MAAKRRKGMSGLDYKKRRLGIILITPSLVLIALVSLYPFFKTISNSLHSIRLNVPAQGQPFVGLANYITLFSTARFLNSLFLTFVFAITFVALEMILGFFIAQVLNMNFFARPIVRASILIPWAMAAVISAILWQWMYNAVFGVINWLFIDIGILQKPIDFLGISGLSAYFSVMAVDLWQSTPFVAIILLAGLQSVPKELYEAAKIDGAGRTTCTLKITIPQIKQAILVALLFRSIDAIRSFDLLFVMTQGGPGTSTEIGSLYSYKLLFTYLDFGRGAASTIVMSVITILLSILYIRVISTDKGE